ncbi:MAG: xanthine dehydrogenase family protein molybdopterin-binding subunit [Chloroflexi bacterium]|nr:xanthine dehydrogenase family protein molybdopterin-binding subunit [Chloroflexota bacterium]
MSAIGKSQPRIDARDKVTGKADYAGDLKLPDMLQMKILFAGRPHAIVKSIDIRKAAAVEGVKLVLTAADVPKNEYGLQIADQPVLCGPGSDIAYADRVRFIGDQVAAVVAESEEIAAYACNLIEVVYEDLPLLLDPFESTREGAILLHPDKKTNIYESYRIRKGDPEKAFLEADVIVEGEYNTPVQEHAYLQPEAGLAYIDEKGRITVAAAGQWAHEEQEEIAHSLQLEMDQVRVIHPAIGGAFGGREDISVQIVLALAVLRLREQGIHRPVRIVWSREESIIGHHKRHAYHIKTRWAATREGIVTAAEIDVIADGGAYMYTSNKVLANATIGCTGPYDIPHIKVDTRAVATNKVPGGAFRGFGGPQGAFSAESQMNKLAEALNMDPVELRLKNVLKKGSISSVGSPLPGIVNVDDVLERCAKESFWEKDNQVWSKKVGKQEQTSQVYKRGIGFACGLKNIGFSAGYQENSWATVEIHGADNIEQVIVRHAAAEVGQGTHTAIQQMTAEGVGVPVDLVKLISADTGETRDSGSVSASRMTFMAGNSVVGAAKEALEKWHNEERPAVSTYQYLAPKTTKFDPETGASTPNFAYGYVAQAVELTVDTETGQIGVDKIYSTHDVGKAINPDQLVGQIEGGVIQALGYVLTENFIEEDGYVITDKLSTYLIPTVQDIPALLKSVVMENPDPNGPWGALGVAEMPFISLAPAITAAVHDATGIWFDDFPLTPERVLRGLGKI